MVVLGTRKMGAQTERKAQNKLPQLDNSERCIICYEAHTVTESETGISFELRNLKDIFVRCFDIQFLPKFSEYGPVHMCTRCHEEFSKVEKLYDAVKCTENSFDAAREKLAFLVVDSIFKSGYISNWVHGNAFDAIRCLVFKAWSTKFKKQGQSKKGNNNKNRNNSVNLDENSQSEITATQDTAGSVKNSTDETKISADKTITGEDEKIPPPLTKILPPLTKISPQKNNKSVQKKASTESKTISTEKAGNPDQPPVQEAKVTEGKAQSPSHQLVTSSVDPECEKNSDGPPVLVKQVEDRNEENQSASISSTNVTKESSQSTQSEKTVKKTSKPSPSSVSAKSEAAEDEDLVRKSSIPSSAAEKTQADAPPPLRASIPKPVHPTYMLSPDGKKLMSNTGGVLQNTRLIFVKKDPVTGKMIQVPRPNIGSVKGKLNGKDVIVHTAPNSANNRVQIRPLGVTSTDPLSTITKMIPRSKVSTSSIAVTISKASTDSPPVPKIVSVQSMQNGPQTKPVVSASSPPKLELAVKQKNEPAVKQKSEPAVKQKNEPAVKPKNEPVVKQKSEPDDTKSIEDNKGPQSKQQQQQPAVLEESPEQRSSRSGRRIKRPFESSDWASGHEMNKLLSHSIKVGRHQQHSPNKRQKGDVLKASTPIITSELLDTSDQPEEEEASKE